MQNPFNKNPQTLTQILQTGLEIGKNTFTRVVPLSFLYAVFNTIPRFANRNVIHATVEPNHPIQVAEGVETIQRTPAEQLILLAVIIITTSLLLALFAALLIRMNSIVESQEKTLSESISLGLKKILNLWGIAITFAVCTLIGTLLLIIPGIYIMVLLYFGIFTLVLRNLPVFAALRRSKELVQGHWFRTATVIFGVTIVSSFLYLLLIYPLRTYPMARMGLEILFITFITPITTGIFMAFFYDLETRNALKNSISNINKSSTSEVKFKA